MSRLTRYKKGPVVKLPPRKSRFEEDEALDSDDDDDFKKPPPNRSKNDSSKSNQKKEIVKNAKSPETAAEEEISVCKYFRSSNSAKATKEKPEVEIPKTLPERKIKPITSSKNSEKQSKIKDEKAKKNCIAKDEESASFNKEALVEVEATGPGPTPVFCPFCMKKLNDKLNGITHIKACAKGLPIEKIYEAILLQEKQIEEWQKLGLDFPAASSENKRDKKGPKKGPTSTSTAKKGGGNRRKQACDDGGADANLELALALSISLHEEAESRKQEEKRLLIENGLENEVEAVDTKQIPLPGPSNSITSEPNSSRNATTAAIVPNPGITTNTNRRRGKRIVHEKLPIATIDEVQKKNLIVEQLTKVYNEAENAKQEVFNVRGSLPKDIAQVPKRLREFHNMMSEKWNAAKCDPDLSSATFKVEGLIDETLVTTQANSETNYSDSDYSSRPQSEDLKQENFGYVDEQDAVITTAQLESKQVSAKLQTLPSRSTRQSSIKRSRNTPEKCDLISNPKKGSDKPLSRTSTSTASSPSSLCEQLPQFVQDVANMLLNKIACDVSVYGREEKGIKCHTFILRARCPKLLDEVVVESSRKKLENRNLIPLTSYTHEAVKVFLWYLYTGTLESNDSKILNEVHELALEYDVIICEEFRKQTDERKDNEKVITADVLVQTDSVTVIDQSTFTAFEDEDQKIETYPACDDDAILIDDNDSNLSVELFTTINEKDDSIINSNSFTKTNNDNVGNPPTVAATSTDHSIEIMNTSVDLFLSDAEQEDILQNQVAAKNDEKIAESEPIKKFEPKTTDNSFQFDVSSSIRIDESFGSTTINENPDDVGYLFEDLTNPSGLHSLSHPSDLNNQLESSSERKRSRSVSLSPEGLHTATDVANYIQRRQDGKCDKVSKRQKFSNDHINNDAINDGEVENLGNTKHKSNDEIMEFENNIHKNASVEFNNDFNDTFDKLVWDGELCSALKTPKTLKASSLIRSVSTPNLTINNKPTLSPLCNQQESVNDVFENDPFDDGDDSVFANIALSDNNFGNMDDRSINNHSSPLSNNFSHNKNDQTSTRPPSDSTPSTSNRSRRKLSPRNLSVSSSEDHTTAPSKKKDSKASKSNKNKSQAKLKLPKKKQLPELEEESVVCSLPTPDRPLSSPLLNEPVQSKKTNGKGKKNQHQSPMLNYSLIDTPVLKQELKRYGIKPLPRSKAKVLLRHIYKETHK